MPRARTVLLVDDNAKIRQLLCSLFEASGFEVCAEAANGAEAIEQAARFVPDLIVMDLAMPGMNGFEAAKILRQTLPAVPILLFTEFADSIAAREALETGITSVVPKSKVELLIAEAERYVPLRKFAAES